MAFDRFLKNSTALGTGLAFLFGISGGVALTVDVARADPAVSKVNWKLDIAGGGARPGYGAETIFSPTISDVESVFRVRGAVSIPLAYSYGLQLDASVGSYSSEAFGHGAAHVFWRDPSVALAGVYGSWTHWNGIDAFRTGVEGEYYAGRFTLSGMVGAEFGDVDNDVYTYADISFYATDNFKLKVGHHYAPEVGNMLTGGMEYQFHSTPRVGYAAYVDARVGDNDFQSVFAGMKMYFGEDKSLMRRHREDDPDFRDDLGSVISCLDSMEGPGVDSTVLEYHYTCGAPFDEELEPIPEN